MLKKIKKFIKESQTPKHLLTKELYMVCAMLALFWPAIIACAVILTI